MQPHQGFSDRFQQACREKNLKTTQRALGAYFHVSEITARHWWLGEKLPGMTNAVAMAERLGVQVEWLLTGRGPKYPADAGSEINTPTTLDPQIVIEILELLDQRDDPKRLTNQAIANVICDAYPKLLAEKKRDYESRARSIVLAAAEQGRDKS